MLWNCKNIWQKKNNNFYDSCAENIFAISQWHEKIASVNKSKMTSTKSTKCRQPTHLKIVNSTTWTCTHAKICWKKNTVQQKKYTFYIGLYSVCSSYVKIVSVAVCTTLDMLLYVTLKNTKYLLPVAPWSKSRNVTRELSRVRGFITYYHCFISVMLLLHV